MPNTMKSSILTIIGALALASPSFAHEAVTIGPNGGRVIYVDSTTTPNVEVIVNKEGQAEISLLDKDRKPITLDKQAINVTAGPRADAKKLTAEKKGAKFVTEKVPAGAPYTIVMQLKESSDAKTITLRLNYDPTPAASGKPSYLDDSVNAQSGDNIEVPGTAAGIWAELNQHQMELVDGVAEKKYEAIDEVTRAYPKLAKGLPPKSGDKESAAKPLVESLLKHLSAVREASAARKLEGAKSPMENIVSTLAELKKIYPADVSNAKLSE
jgi:hypothetical protein